MPADCSLTWTDPSNTLSGGIVYAFWEGYVGSGSGATTTIFEAYYVENTGKWNGPYNPGLRTKSFLLFTGLA